MSDTVEILADEFKLGYPLTYDAVYNRGRADAIDTYEKRLIEHIKTCKALYNSAKRAGNKQGMLIHDSKIAALEWELERLKNE